MDLKGIDHVRCIYCYDRWKVRENIEEKLVEHSSNTGHYDFIGERFMSVEGGEVVEW